MKKASLFASTAFGLALTQSVAAADIVESADLAANIVNHITQSCQNPNDATACIAAGVDASNTIAQQWGDYISEVILPTQPLAAGIAHGDLLADCTLPMQVIGGRDYSSLQNYLDAAFRTVASCEDSIARTGEHLGVDYEPTARNTVSCHLNRLKGYECE